MSSMKVEQVTARIGAEVSGIDVSQPLDDATIAAITEAFHQHSVLFFSGQRPLSPAEQASFARQFGEVEVDDFQTHASILPEVMTLDQIAPKGQGSDHWHTDSTYHLAPPQGTMLQMHVLPESGGDTLFASMYAAYELLSPPMQRLLDGLSAVHETYMLLERTRNSGLYEVPDSIAKAPPVTHPVVHVHPDTRRKSLNVNSQWTTRIEGMSKAESDALLAMLYEHVKSPEIQVRWRWHVGDIAFFDNLCTQHYAVADYDTRRVIQRVALAGKRPMPVPAERRREMAAAG
jgi:taurine dioxygenase